MDFFDRHKALIITVLFFAVLLLSLYNFNLSNNNAKTRELLVDLDNFKIEEKKQEDPEKPEEEQITSKKNSIQTHQAFNENSKAQNENFNSKLSEIFEKNSAKQELTSTDEAAGTTGNYSMGNKAAKKVEKKSDGNNSNEKTSQNTGGYDRSSISYSLRDRNAYDIPNPIYTCDMPGKIVVNITVNGEGQVLTTSFNKASSSTTNECLVENALEYAAKAVFSPMTSRAQQIGTITYNFKPQ